MSRGTKVVIIAVGIVVVLPIIAVVAIVGLFFGISEVNPSQILSREIPLANHATLIIDGDRRGRSEHGFSQRVGYRPAGTAEIEWFGDVSDGVEPQVYPTGPLLVVIDLPSAQLFVRTHEHSWKSLALIFPNDLGPSFPISYYAERNSLTTDEVSRINELGGKRERKWPTTYIQSFDPETRDLKCSYWVDNKSSWPLRFRLSEDGSHLALLDISRSSP